MGSIAYSRGPFPTRESLAARHGLTLGTMELYREIVVNAPAASAWAILGEQFGQIAAWAAPDTATAASPVSGAVRDVPARPCRGGWHHDAARFVP